VENHVLPFRKVARREGRMDAGTRVDPECSAFVQRDSRDSRSSRNGFGLDLHTAMMASTRYHYLPWIRHQLYGMIPTNWGSDTAFPIDNLEMSCRVTCLAEQICDGGPGLVSGARCGESSGGDSRGLCKALWHV